MRRRSFFASLLATVPLPWLLRQDEPVTETVVTRGKPQTVTLVTIDPFTREQLHAVRYTLVGTDGGA